MDSLFHFVMPILAALAARLNIKHQIKTILAAAFFSVLIDIDHFIYLDQYRALFHNIFITLIVPIALVCLSFHLKLDKYKKGFFLLLLIFMSGHLLVDLFSYPIYGSGIGINSGDGIPLFYPLSNERYYIDFSVTIPMAIPTNPQFVEGYIVSSLGFGLLLYLIMVIIPCLFLDDIIEISERKHESFRKATTDFFKKVMKD
ncbi:MAG: metal-dependent hydrolase [Candidatus Aenigmarchaeota archaeon]|nr:metal-dependent hydrolase [Candidatus Aenigmarchaeota archaeon]